MKDLRNYVRMFVEMSSKVKLAAIMLIINDEGKILSVSRKDDPTQLGLPGGKVDPGEEPKDAAIRELKEETGLVASNLKQVFVHHEPGRFKTFTFVGNVEGIIGSKEEGALKWVTPTMLLDPKISPYHPYNTLLFKRMKIKA